MHRHCLSTQAGCIWHGACQCEAGNVWRSTGADEDRMGQPFVGAAGQLMDKILIASGLRREEVYIMNSLKCRPPDNRTPTESEVENCRPFFESQLETIQQSTLFVGERSQFEQCSKRPKVLAGSEVGFINTRVPRSW